MGFKSDLPQLMGLMIFLLSCLLKWVQLLLGCQLFRLTDKCFIQVLKSAQKVLQAQSRLVHCLSCSHLRASSSKTGHTVTREAGGGLNRCLKQRLSPPTLIFANVFLLSLLRARFGVLAPLHTVFGVLALVLIAISQKVVHHSSHSIVEAVTLEFEHFSQETPDFRGVKALVLSRLRQQAF